MRAMLMEKPRDPLKYCVLAKPHPNKNEILIKTTGCVICRTDLQVVDGELKNPKLPVIPGYPIVGSIEEMGISVAHFAIGQRVGVPWLGGSCGISDFGLTGRENLYSCLWSNRGLI